MLKSILKATTRRLSGAAAESRIKSPGERAAAGRIVAITNQKGGVGKTTTAVNLAAALAAVGQRILVVDLDPQANASTGLGVVDERERGGTYDLLLGQISLDDAVLETGLLPGLCVIPSTIALSAAEIELVDEEKREGRLRASLRASRRMFDYVLVDCPPALGLLTVNGLVAADSVIIPMQCEFYALQGLSRLVRTIERVRMSFNSGLKVNGIVLTMYDVRNRQSAEVSEDVRKHFGPRVFETVIPRNVTVSEAPSHGVPVLLYDQDCTGSRAYASLASEFLRRQQAA